MSVVILFLVLYLVLFLNSFLLPKHPHVLNVYFGVPGSGKTTFAAYLTKWALHENWIIRLCRRFNNPISRLILNSKYLKRRIDVYSNVPMDLYSMGTPILDTKRIFAPPLWKLFNSYSRKELPKIDWLVW